MPRTTGARVSLLAVGVLLSVWCFADAQTSVKPYTLILDFVPTGEYVPHYTALEKGWYREEGLDVKIIRGQGSADTVKRIAAGQGDVGIADISTVIAARANTDAKVKAIALWYRRPPDGIFLRADSPIKSPKELAGKKLAISPGNSHQILWPMFEKLSGLAKDSVTWVTMDAASMPPALINGQTDAVPFFVVHEARIRKIAETVEPGHPRARRVGRSRPRSQLDLADRAGRNGRPGPGAAEGLPPRHPSARPTMHSGRNTSTRA